MGQDGFTREAGRDDLAHPSPGHGVAVPYGRHSDLGKEATQGFSILLALSQLSWPSTSPRHSPLPTRGRPRSSGSPTCPRGPRECPSPPGTRSSWGSRITGAGAGAGAGLSILLLILKASKNSKLKEATIFANFDL